MALETVVPYTTQAAVERYYSIRGATLQTDDLLGSNLTDFWIEILAYASDIINTYLSRYHSDADLATSRWVNMRTTIIACYVISQRRGNPHLFQTAFDEVIEELKLINEFRPVPRLPISADFSPVMSNVIVDDRFGIKKLRVHTVISTGGATTTKQDMSFLLNFLWL